MKTLATAHRKAVNQAAHAYALKVELDTRAQWMTTLREALDAGATFAEIHATIAQLTNPHGQS